LFNRPGGDIIPVGEVCRLAKVKFGNDPSVANARKFTLIGEPSLKLALPKFKVETNFVNGKIADTTFIDTLKALQKVKIEGSIKDYQNNLVSNFNGKIYVTVFDKVKDYKTLGQDKSSPIYNFTLQKNVLFKGVASVINGLFTVSFVMPKDIDYNFGNGKISYYAENGKDLDANGNFNGIIIGGSTSDIIKDDTPPKVQVYLNSENFVKGGLTDANPTLLAKISDDLGINVTGTSIGHDLTVIIDENTQNQIVLNDFYESVLDDPTKGTVKYPLKNIAPGTHTLRVKAWDVTNKSGEGTTEFVVAQNGVLALDHVLNYPNPFTTSTAFQFEHNFGNKNLHARISIYSVSGTLVKTIHQNVSGSSSRISGLNWDGKDDYGNDLAKGVYIYKIAVTELNGDVSGQKAESDYEKLVILK
jgi:flagellar hook assembly protein FlgD